MALLRIREKEKETDILTLFGVKDPMYFNEKQRHFEVYRGEGECDYRGTNLNSHLQTNSHPKRQGCHALFVSPLTSYNNI